MPHPESESPFPTTLHSDGTVTFWSVFTQTWRRLRDLPVRDLDALGPDDRDAVLAHWRRHNGGE